MFYLLSFYLVLKKWYLSPPSYLLSLFSKGLATTFLPITFFVIYISTLPKNKKIFVTVVYSIITIFIIVAILTGRSQIFLIGFDATKLLFGFTLAENFLRSDGLILMFLLPVIVGLFALSKKGVQHANSVMVLIMGGLWSNPLLSGLTDEVPYPYRYVPIVIFFAIGAGTLFSKKTGESYHNRTSTIIFFMTLATVIITLSQVFFPYLIGGNYRTLE
jgi:hypothetical protein